MTTAQLKKALARQEYLIKVGREVGTSRDILDSHRRQAARFRKELDDRQDALPASARIAA